MSSKSSTKKYSPIKSKSPTRSNKKSSPKSKSSSSSSDNENLGREAFHLKQLEKQKKINLNLEEIKKYQDVYKNMILDIINFEKTDKRKMELIKNLWNGAFANYNLEKDKHYKTNIKLYALDEVLMKLRGESIRNKNDKMITFIDKIRDDCSYFVNYGKHYEQGRLESGNNWRVYSYCK